MAVTECDRCESAWRSDANAGGTSANDRRKSAVLTARAVPVFLEHPPPLADFLFEGSGYFHCGAGGMRLLLAKTEMDELCCWSWIRGFG